jgi:N-acetylglucosaminyldiphosphoundecaprenol N-acetyl-beta-D-mannosaminyltransferase
MHKYFNINFEFDHQCVDNIVIKHITKKIPGYICTIEGSNLGASVKHPGHLEVLNGAIVNVSDSSWLPMVINRIHGTKYKSYSGPEIFYKYIKMKCFKHFFLGSTEEVLSGLRHELSKTDKAIAGMIFKTLPFNKVEEFDYDGIAKEINDKGPDIIWVSLGAPKQEQFMYRLKPYLNSGVMIGVGAAFNFYCGPAAGIKRAPKLLRACKLEWLYRTIKEPRKQTKRIAENLGLVLNAYIKEYKKVNSI